MSRWLRSWIAAAALAGVIPAALPADPGHTSADAGSFRFEPPPVGSYELPPIDHVSEHVLLASSGRPAPLLDLRPGEAALVSFVYLSCGEECPLSTATLHRLDRTLARDSALARRVKLVTVSFDPARDTPARMADLAEHLAPKGRWQFLTGESSAALEPVLADFGQDSLWIPGDGKAPGRLRHVLKVFLVDARGDVRNVYSTGLLDERLVLNDLRTVLGAPR
jgi:cytochrome oxidase Cu insertion factor (SCO1/SenC/PrrC family)